MARINSSVWAISSRGFDDEFANQLLVLVDGRDVYNPLFSGTYWDVQDTLLEDVDRIEVIRGPGSTLWGANAVNGVINVITKPASQTHGLLAVAGGGSYERAFGGGRWGGSVGDTFHYRGYAKYADRSAFERADGRRAHDGWDQTRGGARFDWTPWSSGAVTLQGDYYTGRAHETDRRAVLGPPYERDLFGLATNLEGADVVARLGHRFSPRSDAELQVYWDDFRRTVTERDGLGQSVQTFDVRFQHRFGLPWSADVVWGTEYRRYDDDIRPGANLTLRPTRLEYELVSGFLQGELPLFDDTLALTAGTKLEYHEFSGFEYQPSARIGWHPHERHFLWGAVSRAVRTPSRVEEDVVLEPFALPIRASGPPVTLAGLVRVLGDHGVRSETVLAWEGGYRVRPWDTVSLDVAAFYADYDHLSSLEARTPRLVAVTGALPYVVLPFRFENRIHGTTYGTEVTLGWQALRALRLTLDYTYLEIATRSPTSVPVAAGVDVSGLGGRTDPHHQVGVRASVNLPHHVEADALVYYTDRLPAGSIPSWVRLDLRVGWRPVEQVELAVVGQNLTEEHHAEFGNILGIARPAEYPRGVYGKLTLRY